jgi:hypothetical protein
MLDIQRWPVRSQNGKCSRDNEAVSNWLLAHYEKIDYEDGQRRDYNDRFGSGESQQRQIINAPHNPAPFRIASNKGDPKLGTIKSSSNRGYSPTTNVVAMRMTAPIRSGIDIGSNGSRSSLSGSWSLKKDFCSTRSV